MRPWYATFARLALVLPIVVLSLLPQGFMPDRNAAGQMVLVLCTPDGPVEMAVDLGKGQSDTGNPPGTCDWSLAHAALDLTPPASLPLAPVTATQALATTAALLWHPAHDPRGIWARGPPSLT